MYSFIVQKAESPKSSCLHALCEGCRGSFLALPSFRWLPAILSVPRLVDAWLHPSLFTWHAPYIPPVSVSLLFYKDTGHIGLKLIILTWLLLQWPYFQISSRSQALGVRTWISLLGQGEDTLQLTTASKTFHVQLSRELYNIIIHTLQRRLNFFPSSLQQRQL